MPYKDKDRQRAADLAYYYRNHEKRSAARRAWKAANRDRIREQDRARRRGDPRGPAQTAEQRAQDRIARREIPKILNQLHREISRREGRASTVQRVKHRAEITKEKRNGS